MKRSLRHPSATHPIPLRSRVARMFLLAALTAGLFPMALPAQFQMILDLPDLTEYPLVHLPLQVVDNSASITTLDTSHFTVRENGIVQYPLILDCTKQEVPQSINFIFVLDRSLSMGFKEGTMTYDLDSVKWRRAKQVFVDSFRKLRPSDRGAFISFCREVDMEQPFTSNIRDLENAIAGLALCSGTSIYDALMYSLSIGAAQQGKTVIIILTDGSDQTSLYDSVAVVNRGRELHIPIYSIGLGVAPGDVAVFRFLSQSTGGEYFIAPTSEQLADVFNRIMKSIFSSRCILSYIPSDSCQRGNRRDVVVTVKYNGSTATESTYYTVPDLRSRTKVSLEAQMFEDDQQALVPVYIHGELRPNEPLDFECIVRYDPAMFAFRAVGTAGSLLDPQALLAQQSPGQCIIQGDAVMPARGVPYGQKDVLCVLQFDVLHQDRNHRTSVSVMPVNFRQNCDMLTVGDSATFTVLGCPSRLRIGIDSHMVVGSGHEFSIPVTLADVIDLQQHCQYSFTVSYDPSLIEYIGISTANTISDGITVSVTEPIPGALSITSVPEYPAYSTGPIIFLRFKASRQLAARQVQFTLSNMSFIQSCTPVIEFASGKLFIDGECERMLIGTPTAGIRKVSPHPVSLSRAGPARVTLLLSAAGHVRLTLVDIHGRRVATILDALKDAGSHTIPIPLGGVVPGPYLLVLDAGAAMDTAPIIVTR